MKRREYRIRGAVSGLANSRVLTAQWPRRIGSIGAWGNGDVEGTRNLFESVGGALGEHICRVWRLDKLRLRLRELGWIEGENLKINVRGNRLSGVLRVSGTKRIRSCPR
jgi:hypothetical protein